VNPHALPEQLAVALATRVEQALPHVLQFLASVVVSTQVPLQTEGVDDGHPEAHAYVLPEATQAGVEPLHAWPQAPQLAVVVSATQAPPHAVVPALQVKVQALFTHTACAPVTVVVHACPHEPQLFASLVSSTQLPLQFVDADDGHPAAQAYAPPEAAQTAVAPPHALPHEPQLAAVVSSTHAPEHRL
jgi:hypothetical protein